MTIEEMIKRKQELGYTYETISERSGVPLATVQKVLGGTTKAPRFDTIRALESVLGPQEWEIPVYCGRPYPSPGMVKEPKSRYGAYQDGTAAYRMPNCYPLLPYKNQGEYTAEDREKLPGDVRTELINGELFDMASPKAVHQIIVGEVSGMLRDCVQKSGKDCIVFVAPSDVWITNDNKNILQPDVYVICDYSMIRKDGFTKGAPPLVIEVLSSSTRSKDMLLKTYIYCKAGVQEYWIIDPEKRWVRVYLFKDSTSGTEYTEYGFDSEVPVGISEGNCSVDFRKVAAILDKIPV